MFVATASITHRGVSTFSSNAEYCNAQFCKHKSNTVIVVIVFHTVLHAGRSKWTLQGNENGT